MPVVRETVFYREGGQASGMLLSNVHIIATERCIQRSTTLILSGIGVSTSFRRVTVQYFRARGAVATLRSVAAEELVTSLQQSVLACHDDGALSVECSLNLESAAQGSTGEFLSATEAD